MPRPPCFPTACGLPQAWGGQAAWRVLDTELADGAALLATWQMWADDPRRPHLLHYVALTPEAPAYDSLARTMDALALPAIHRAALQRQWYGLSPGFHRLVLHGGQLLLTLCIGPLQAMLRAQRFVADSVYLVGSTGGAPRYAWDRWSIKALARVCRRGTRLAGADALPVDAFVHAGFVLDERATAATASVAGDATHGVVQGAYLPRWEPGASRDRWRANPDNPSTCVVVGAGLAGAAAAAALARRGWQVTVLDAAEHPAAGASGLPVGVLAPLVSRDDNPRARLSRTGVRLTLDACHRLLRSGEDWSPTGLRTVSPDGTAWQAHAAWVRPARLVQAWLAQPGVRFVGSSRVASMRHDGGQWTLHDAGGRTLAQAGLVVVAAAGDTVACVNQAGPRKGGDAASQAQLLAPWQALAGQVSWGLHPACEGDACFPRFPVNGDGSFVGHVPVPEGRAWYAGATYEPLDGQSAAPPQPVVAGDGARDAASTRAAAIDAAHRDNLARLGRLLPDVARTLQAAFEAGAVNAWRGTRHASADRMPAVGRAQTAAGAALWVSSAMGSRGLSFALLCAELVAAELAGEPLPIDTGQWKALQVSRPRLRAGGTPGRAA